MFADVYRESLEGALRRDGPLSVLGDVRQTMRGLVPELHADAARDVLALVELMDTLTALIDTPRHAALNEGLNAALASDSADCVYCGNAASIHADDGCRRCATGVAA